LVEYVRQTRAGAGRPAAVKAAVLALISTDKIELTPELTLRSTSASKPNKPDRYTSGTSYAAHLVQEITSSSYDRSVIQDMVLRAFKAGVKEGRRRQLLDIKRDIDKEMEATHSGAR